MTAAEALRRARATMECNEFDATGECSITLAWTTLGDDFACTHHEGASALLDGFSVEEVTAAEHTTDQPHE